MKKAVFIALVTLAFVFSACKDNVTTQYTIGCLGHQAGAVEVSQWEELENYFKDNVDYNKIVSFEGHSLAENDAQAREYYHNEIVKVDTAYVCSLISDSDYFVYGIATINADGSYRIIKAMKFQANGASEVED